MCWQGCTVLQRPESCWELTACLLRICHSDLRIDAASAVQGICKLRFPVSDSYSSANALVCTSISESLANKRM